MACWKKLIKNYILFGGKEMKSYALYQGEAKLLTCQAKNRADAANFFRKYLINELSKSGLYGCTIVEE